MPTIDLTVGGTTGYPDHAARKSYVVEREVDFSEAANALAQNDVAQLINIPAGSWVALVHWEVKTVEGVAATFDLGDVTDPNGYTPGGAADANALGSGVSGPVVLAEALPNTVIGYSAGKYYAAADTIDLTAIAAGGLDTAAVIKVTAHIINMN